MVWVFRIQFVEQWQVGLKPWQMSWANSVLPLIMFCQEQQEQGVNEEIINNKANKTGKSFTEIAEAMKNASPAKRFAKPEEIEAVSFFMFIDMCFIIS